MHILRALSALVLATLLWTATLGAQEANLPDYEAWTDRATAAENTLDAGRASEESLDVLRADIATWREQFSDALEVNAARISALQSQINALGPVPEEGAEPDEIAERRAALNALLTEARAPVLRAEEAYTRADGIIRGIDTLIRDRQADAFWELGPSPLNPAHWPTALSDIAQSVVHFWTEVRRNADSAALRSLATENLPAILSYLLLGLVLLFRGARWARLAVFNMRLATRRGTGVWRFVLSLGQVVLPLAGLWAITQAALATGYVGLRWSLMVEQLPFWAGTLLGIRWLADQAFADDDEDAILVLAPPERASAKRAAKGLAILYVLDGVLNSLTQFDGYGAETVAVLNFPVLLLSGLLLARLGAVRNEAPFVGSPEALEDEGPFKMRFARLLGRAAIACGLVGAGMAAVGYFNAGERLVYPAVASLALIGLVMVLQRFIDDVFFLITGRDPDTSPSLLPVLAGFGLVIAALPALALALGRAGC